jgi:hypothetical protein
MKIILFDRRNYDSINTNKLVSFKHQNIRKPKCLAIFSFLFIVDTFLF